MAAFTIDNSQISKDPTIYHYNISGGTNYVPIAIFYSSQSIPDDATRINSHRITESDLNIPTFTNAACARNKDGQGSPYINDSYPMVFKEDGLSVYSLDGKRQLTSGGSHTSARNGYNVAIGALAFPYKGSYLYLYTTYLTQTSNSKDPDDVAAISSTDTKGVLGGNIIKPQFNLGSSSGFQISETLQHSNDFADIMKLSKLYDENDPYGGGEEQDNPGDGEFDYSGDLVDVPDLPTISVTDSGFVRLFAPTETELRALASFMWSDAFSLDTFKKLFADPMDCILGLSIVPVKLPTGGQESITIGNIVSTVSCTKCTSQYVKLNCGSFTFSSKKFTGSYLDYSPYLKCYLYLPFIGTQQIDIDEFMGATMSIEYHVDILTGAMFCFVSTTKGSPKGKKLVYTYAGQCAENVPLSSTSYGNTIASILQAASSIGAVAATAATGGAAAPVAAGLLASASTATANAATSMKPNIQHSGSVSGGSGIMGVRYPYLIFEAPWIVPVTGQQNYTGFASGKVVKLSSLSGFATIEAINLSVKGATDEELREIKSVLQEGVIL